MITKRTNFRSKRKYEGVQSIYVLFEAKTKTLEDKRFASHDIRRSDFKYLIMTSATNVLFIEYCQIGSRYLINLHETEFEIIIFMIVKVHLKNP